MRVYDGRYTPQLLVTRVQVVAPTVAQNSAAAPILDYSFPDLLGSLGTSRIKWY